MKRLLSFFLTAVLVFCFVLPSFAVDAEPSSGPEAPQVLYVGDVDRDFAVTAADARLVLRFSARLIKFTLEQCVIADADDSGRVDASDARRILRTSARLEDRAEFSKTVSDPDKVVSSYGYEPYQATLPGFETNIDTPEAFGQVRELEEYCAQLAGVATIYYTDVAGRYYISYNGDTVYRTHCTIKAPYCKAALVYMEQNNIPLSTKLTLTEDAKWPTHVLSDYPSGTKFTIEELMSRALTYSDNTAYQMLFNYFGNDIFNKSAEAAGAKVRLGTYMFGETSARDMSKLYLDIYRYDGKFRDFLYWQMDTSNPENTGTELIAGYLPEQVRVLHKLGTGSTYRVGMHDCAIINTNHPFVLCVYTSINMDMDNDQVPFRCLGAYCYNVNVRTAY